MDRDNTVQRTTRQIKETHLALFYKNALGGYGTDGHHRLMMIAIDAEEKGARLDAFTSDLYLPDNWVEIQEPKRV